jgi:hypothetical protein
VRKDGASQVQDDAVEGETLAAVQSRRIRQSKRELTTLYSPIGMSRLELEIDSWQQEYIIIRGGGEVRRLTRTTFQSNAMIQTLAFLTRPLSMHRFLIMEAILPTLRDSS